MEDVTGEYDEGLEISAYRIIAGDGKVKFTVEF